MATCNHAPVAGQLSRPRLKRKLARQTRRNIVFMMVDNFGNGDLGCYGGDALMP
jgi:hypothetical protein